MSTKSERLFEGFLIANGITFSRIDRTRMNFKTLPQWVFAATGLTVGAILAGRAAVGPFNIGIIKLHSPLSLESVFAVAFLGMVWLAAGVQELSEPHRNNAFSPWLLLLTLGLVAFPFARNLWDPFLSDDYILVSRASGHWPLLGPLFTTPGGDGAFRPLGNIYFYVVGFWANHDPFSWHLAGLCLHLLNCSLLYGIAWSLWTNNRLAACASLLFGWHGTRPEVVTWTAGQFDLLALGLVLAAMLCLFWERTPTAGAVAIALALLIAAILCKESAYAAPFALACLAVAGNRWQDRRVRKALLLALLVCVVSLAYRWHLFNGPGGYVYGNGNPQILSLRLLPTMKALVFRIWAILLFPFNWDAHVNGVYISVAAVLTCGGLVLATPSHGVRRATVLSLLGFSLCAVLPAIHLALIGQSGLGSRVLYLPSVGCCLLQAHLLGSPKTTWRRNLAAAALLIATLLGLCNNLRAWHNTAILAELLCAEASLHGVSEKPPGIVNGVYFFANGFPECVTNFPKKHAE